MRRRLSTGVSNAKEFEDSSENRSNSRKFKLGVRADRLQADRIHDKLFFSLKPSRVREVFRKMDTNRDGTVSHDELRNALGNLTFGLKENDVQRLINTLDPNQDGAIDYDEFMEFFEKTTPLGEAGHAIFGDNIQTAAPWEKLQGKTSSWNTGGAVPDFQSSLNRHEDGSYEQQSEDAHVFDLISNKFYQRASRLRHIFRQLDTNRNGKLDKHEFVKGVQALNMQIPQQQIERYFDVMDRDSHGYLEYDEYIRKFEVGAGHIQPHHNTTKRKTLYDKFEVTKEDVQAIQRDPRLNILRERISMLGSTDVVNRFRLFDTNKDGYLSTQELTNVVNNIGAEFKEKEVAALVISMDSSGDGYLSFREFLQGLDLERFHPRIDVKKYHTSRIGDSPIFQEGPPKAEAPLLKKLLEMKENKTTNQGHRDAIASLRQRILDEQRRPITSDPSELNRLVEQGWRTLEDLRPKTSDVCSRVRQKQKFLYNPPPKNTLVNTQPNPKSTMYMSPKEAFQRKSEGILLQEQEKVRKDRLLTLDTLQQKYKIKQAYEQDRKQRDEENKQQIWDKRMESLAHQNRRYTERMVMYNKIKLREISHTAKPIFMQNFC